MQQWKELMNKKRPKDSIRRKLIAKPGETPPLYRYGFPFTRQYALDYARRHHLKLTLADEDGNYPQDISTWEFNFHFSIECVRLESSDDLRINMKVRLLELTFYISIYCRGWMFQLAQVVQ